MTWPLLLLPCVCRRGPCHVPTPHRAPHGGCCRVVVASRQGLLHWRRKPAGAAAAAPADAAAAAARPGVIGPSCHSATAAAVGAGPLVKPTAVEGGRVHSGATATAAAVAAVAVGCRGRQLLLLLLLGAGEVGLETPGIPGSRRGPRTRPGVILRAAVGLLRATSSPCCSSCCAWCRVSSMVAIGGGVGGGRVVGRVAGSILSYTDTRQVWRGPTGACIQAGRVLLRVGRGTGAAVAGLAALDQEGGVMLRGVGVCQAQGCYLGIQAVELVAIPARRGAWQPAVSGRQGNHASN